LPVTLVLPTPHGQIGPGLPVYWSSDFPFPPAAGSEWHLAFASDVEFTDLYITVIQPATQLLNQGWVWYVSPQAPRQEQLSRTFTDGDTVHVQVELVDPNGQVIDSGRSQGTFSSTDGLGNQLAAKGTTGGSGGFTEEDRQLLLETQQLGLATRSATQSTLTTSTGTSIVDIGSLWNWITRDLWSRRDLSGGVTCERIDYDASHAFLFSVRVEIVELPEEIQFRTPDGNYAFHDLAVLSFIQGGVLLARHGIHTISHDVSPLPGTNWYGVSGINAPNMPGDYHIVVDWLPGVCGQLIGEVGPSPRTP
jgi:hypothetical protein